MKKIGKQSLGYSLFNYLGILIGAVSSIFIYPLDFALIGLGRFLIDTASLFQFFVSFGLPTIAIRYFSRFEETPVQRRGFLSYLSVAQLGCFLLFLFLLYLFRESFFGALSAGGFDVALVLEYIWPILGITLLLAYSRLFLNYISNLGDIALPGGINNILPKLLLPTFFLLAVGGYLSQNAFVYGLLLLHLLVLVAIYAYGRYRRHLQFSTRRISISKELRKDIGTYAIFGVLGNIGGVLAFKMDSVMITTLMTPEANGVYSFFFFISNAILVLPAAVNGIVGPMIARSWNEQKLGEIERLYQKTSINLLILGGGCFLLIALSLLDLASLTRESELLSQNTIVFFLLGSAAIVELMTSVNTQIIAFSKNQYYFNLIAIVFLAVLNLVNNYYFISWYGLMGAALSTAISLSLYNLLKTVFIYFKFGIQPLSAKTPLVFLIGALAFLPVYYLLPAVGNAWLDIPLRSLVFGLLFGAMIVFSRISPDITDFVTKNPYLAKVLGFKRK